MKVAFIYLNDEENIGRGAGYVAGAVRATGHDLTYYDTFYISVEKTAKSVLQNKVDVLMISTMTLNFKDALKLVSLVKKEKGDIPVLMGGIHIMIEKQKILEDHLDIDFICYGEGEWMVGDFLNALATGDFSQVPNLAYRKNGRIIVNSVQKSGDLATLPEFPWDLFTDNQIVQQGVGFLYVNATRGCPFICTYCCNKVYLDMYKKSYLRTRPVNDVVRELKFLKNKYNPRLFYFGDEMLLFNRDYVFELFFKFKTEVGGHFGLQGRVEYLKEDVVKFLADCGCKYIGMGVECGDEEFSRKVLKRKLRNQSIVDCMALLRRYNVFVSAFTMIGYPVENDDFLTLKTLSLLSQAKPDYTQMSIFYPFPGTELYEKCIREDLIDSDKANTYASYFQESALKGKDYVGEVQRSLVQILNPKPFPFLQDIELLSKHTGIIKYIKWLSAGVRRFQKLHQNKPYGEYVKEAFRAIKRYILKY